MHIKLRKFDPSKMSQHAVCVMIARRRAGKSTLVLDLMYHHRDIPAAVVCSASEGSNHTYSRYVPDSFIYPYFSEDTISRLIQRQINVMAMNDAAAQGARKVDSRVLLILDDIGFDPKALKSKYINQLFLNGRHHHISMWASLQDTRMLSPCQRGNCDYVFLFKDFANKQRIYDSFFKGIFDSFQTFTTVYDECTDDYGVLVLDQTSQSSNIEDYVFYYKAAPRPPFRFGSPAMWEYHNTVYKTVPPGTAAEEEAKRQKAVAATHGRRGVNPVIVSKL